MIDKGIYAYEDELTSPQGRCNFTGRNTHGMLKITISFSPKCEDKLGGCIECEKWSKGSLYKYACHIWNSGVSII